MLGIRFKDGIGIVKWRNLPLEFITIWVAACYGKTRFGTVSIFPPNDRPATDSAGDAPLALRSSDALTVAASQQIFVSPEENESPWKRAEWQRLWLALQKVPWQSLALVPAGEMPPRFTLEIALSLAYTGSLHLGEPVRMADATGVPLTHLKQFIGEIEALRAQGGRLILALGPLRDSATSAAIAQAADQSLLCVPLEMCRMADAKRTLGEVGKHRFLGSAVFSL